MAAQTALATVATLPHKPVAVAITANQWSVLALNDGALGLALQGTTTDVYGVMFFSIIDTDGPDDGDVSSGAGDYDLADVFQFTGHATVASRPTPSIPLGRQFAASTSARRATHVAITSTANMTVLAMQLGGEQ